MHQKHDDGEDFMTAMDMPSVMQLMHEVRMA